jgi:dTMP kinase
MALFIVFEGIDGSGKTTISSRAARRLREAGVRVEHVREDGKFASHVTQAVRELGRDPRHLALAPVAELLLFATRDAQTVAESIRPALARADVVFADRFTATAATLARFGRGLAEAEVAPVLAVAAGGVAPDLTVLVDVDPHVARARRRVAKLLSGEKKPPSRKGLQGAGLSRRLRTGYLAQAWRDPARWLVLDNTDAVLDDVVARVVDLVQAARRDLPRAVTHARTLESARRAARPAPRRAPTPAAAREALFAWIDGRATTEPGLAAWMLGDLQGSPADARRAHLARLAPEVVAAGLTGRTDGFATRLRRELAEVVPDRVARSLRLLPHEGEVAALRHELGARAPGGVAASLAGQDGDEVDALRAQLYPRAADDVIGSLAGDGSRAAWRLRHAWLDAQGGARALDDYWRARTMCRSLAGLGDDEAWMLRCRARAAAPVESIEGLRALADPRAFAWREEVLEHAPRPVMDSLAGMDDARADALRASAAERCKEAIDSVYGLDSPASWALREQHVGTWPSTVAGSLGPLARGARGGTLLGSLLADNEEDLSLWRHAAKALETAEERR